MDALVFAAGLGTRLRPLTDRRPKAMIEVGGVPMLERVARRLVAAGADRIIVNTHPFPEQIERFVAARDGFGVEVVFSHEKDAPLETGGGLRHAAPLLRGRAPFFMHNADILTDLDLGAMYRAHGKSGALATLAVNDRETTRYLLFDDAGLCGHEDTRSGSVSEARPARGAVRRWAFCGVHVAGPELPSLLTERGAFSIIEPYLRLAGAGYRILSHDIGDLVWVDIGSPEKLERAEEAVRFLRNEPSGSVCDDTEFNISPQRRRDAEI